MIFRHKARDLRMSGSCSFEESDPPQIAVWLIFFFEESDPSNKIEISSGDIPNSMRHPAALAEPRGTLVEPSWNPRGTWWNPRGTLPQGRPGPPRSLSGLRLQSCQLLGNNMKMWCSFWFPFKAQPKGYPPNTRQTCQREPRKMVGFCFGFHSIQPQIMVKEVTFVLLTVIWFKS